VKKGVDTIAWIAFLVLGFGLIAAPPAHAFGSIASAWTAYYDGSPGVTSQCLANMVAATGKTCQLCHESRAAELRGTGMDWPSSRDSTRED